MAPSTPTPPHEISTGRRNPSGEVPDDEETSGVVFIDSAERESPVDAELIDQPIDAHLISDETAIDAEGVDRSSDDADQVIDAQTLDLIKNVEVVQPRSLPFAMLHRFCAVVEWTFGMASLIAILAFLAAIPVIQFISLGYLLETSGSIARTGRLREGFIGIRVAARIGSLVVGTWLCLLPINYLSYLWYQSNLIDPGSTATQTLRAAQLIVTVFMIGHILAAWYCGGRFRHFFWPLVAPFSLGIWFTRWAVSRPGFRALLDNTLGVFSKKLVNDICRCQPLTDWFLPAIVSKALFSGHIYSRARDAVWDFVTGLNLPYYFWLGLRGFAGAVLWLFTPVTMLIAATQLPPGPALLLMFVGVILLTVVAMYLPFLQAHFAAERRFGAFFELGKVRHAYRRAPVACWFSLLITLAFAVPLYLLKVEYAPKELTWILCIAFVSLILPGRLLVGWAVGRGRARQKPRTALWRWTLRPAMFAIAFAYCFFVALAPYYVWTGSWSLIEQHAFLLPAPFFGQ